MNVILAEEYGNARLHICPHGTDMAASIVFVLSQNYMHTNDVVMVAHYWRYELLMLVER